MWRWCSGPQASDLGHQGLTTFTLVCWLVLALMLVRAGYALPMDVDSAAAISTASQSWAACWRWGPTRERWGGA